MGAPALLSLGLRIVRTEDGLGRMLHRVFEDTLEDPTEHIAPTKADILIIYILYICIYIYVDPYSTHMQTQAEQCGKRAINHPIHQPFGSHFMGLPHQNLIHLAGTSV